MELKQEKFVLSLEQAKKELQTADHLAYITYPLIKETKLLLKILEKMHLSLLYAINAILQYEYMYKRIHIYKDSKDNLETFKKIAYRYDIKEEQLKRIKEIFILAEEHKKSPFEFSKKDKIVIMTNSSIDTINIEKIKLYLAEIKDIIHKTTTRLNQHMI